MRDPEEADRIEALLATGQAKDIDGDIYVAAWAGCPQCNERRMCYLVWNADEEVRCSTCGRIYTPGGKDEDKD